jgi:ABC-type multidrug transport system ATPase subunit
MGSSGSGKTTLFNVLNFRNKKKLKINGSIKINGVPIKSAKALSFISGYVEQEDSFIDTLTVKEHLTFHVKKNFLI